MSSLRPEGLPIPEPDWLRDVRRRNDGFVHKEAFCLMKYASDDGTEVEWLWNSRDGVTPFVIANRDGTTQLTHADWHRDTRLPAEFIPPPCMRIFVDMTEAMHREATERVIARHNVPAETAEKLRSKPFEASGEPAVALASEVYHPKEI